MNRGYVRVYRKLMDSKVWRKPNYLKVWLWCLLKASYQTNHIPWRTGKGWTVISVSPGQFVTGRNSGSEQTDLAPSTWWSAMKFFEKEQMVRLKSNSHYTLVTITNWELYQDVVDQSQQPSVQASDSQPTDNQQATDTNNNYKKEEHPKNEEEVLPILHQFNQITGRSFQETEKTINLIRSRLKDGFDPDLIVSVIRHKTKQWRNDPKMSAYLRPTTIFNKEKFENYVQELRSTPIYSGNNQQGQTKCNAKGAKQYGKPFAEIRSAD